MAKLQAMKKDYDRRGFHLQRLYKRRKVDEYGVMRSTFGSIMDPIDTKKSSSISGGGSSTPSASVTQDDLDKAIQTLMNKLDVNKNDIIDESESASSIFMEEF